jgi:hypothetical protein
MATDDIHEDDEQSADNEQTTMKRVTCSTVTDTLMKAVEHAEDMEDVLVIYYARDGAKGSFFCNDGMKANDMLWLVERFKLWLLGVQLRPKGEDGGEGDEEESGGDPR